MTNVTPFSLTNKRILITGASSGIGVAVAKCLAEQGAICIISGRDEDRLQSTLKQLSGNGHIAITSDLSEGNRAELVRKAVTQTAPLNGFVHCAGIEKTLPFRVTTLSDLREIMAVNLEAFWEITRELVKNKNYEKDRLSIIGISSVSSVSGAVGNSAYASSKGALISLIKSLALEYSIKKIRFNAISPAFVDTPMLDAVKKLYKTEEDFIESIVLRHPLGLGTPQDVANAALYLLSDASRWVTGTVLEVDGGYGVR